MPVCCQATNDSAIVLWEKPSTEKSRTQAPPPQEGPLPHLDSRTDYSTFTVGGNSASLSSSCCLYASLRSRNSLLFAHPIM